MATIERATISAADGAGVSRALLSDQVYDLIRGQLLTRDHAPGSRLVESEIARGLGVSQAPVREALRRLAHEGLVLQFPRRGSFVAEISVPEAQDAYEVRAALEPVAVAGLLAAAEGVADEVDKPGVDEPGVLEVLDACVVDMLAAAAADDLPALIEADTRFHSTVWTASGNDTLARVWPIVEASMRNLTLVSNRIYFRSLEQVARTHEPLVAALRRRDPESGALFAAHAVEVWTHVRKDEGADERTG